MPLSLLGLLFYSAILVLTLMLVAHERAFIRRLLFFITILGFLSSIYFLYVQAFLIGAFCIYCIVSAITSTILFLTMLAYVWYASERNITSGDL